MREGTGRRDLEKELDNWIVRRSSKPRANMPLFMQVCLPAQLVNRAESGIWNLRWGPNLQVGAYSDTASNATSNVFREWSLFDIGRDQNHNPGLEKYWIVGNIFRYCTIKLLCGLLFRTMQWMVSPDILFGLQLRNRFSNCGSLSKLFDKLRRIRV